MNARFLKVFDTWHVVIKADVHGRRPIRKDVFEGVILGGCFIQRTDDRRTALETMQRLHGNCFVFIDNSDRVQNLGFILPDLYPRALSLLRCSHCKIQTISGAMR